jgi:ADP-heptose:LPS heptosyltransferase
MKLLLRNFQSPGDVVMMTAAVRDLHRCHPGRYWTAVETSCPALWMNNPYIVPVEQLGTPDAVLECGYPLVHESNRRPLHFVHGFALDLEKRLGVKITVTEFKGDIHLSSDEVEGESPVAQAGWNAPYWVIVAGGKHDFTAKWWDPDSFQKVVDHFQGRVKFVQCGEAGHWHPGLEGVIDLVGKTSLRELVRVVHRAEGVLCPVTLAMHLAAAVPRPPGVRGLRPCVVVAGGREPAHWEAYPGHQFLHTIGALDCCATGGCWKSRCQTVGDGDEKDEDLCVRPVRAAGGLTIAQCMAMITPRRVIEAVEMYCAAGGGGV